MSEQYERTLDAARYVVRLGRWWLDPPDDQVERAARCIVTDPVYRAELLKCAYDRAHDLGDDESHVTIRQADQALDQWDHRPDERS